MKIIRYQFFETEEEFIEWQKDKRREVVNITPQPLNMNSNFNEGNDMSIKFCFGVLVTYLEIQS